MRAVPLLPPLLAAVAALMVLASSHEHKAVARAVDGDTIHVGKTTVRLLGVDTPETKDPRKPVQCFGPQASQFTHAQVDGRTVHVTTEASSGDVKDRYGRTLGYVEVRRHDLGAALLRGGYARVYAYRNRHFGKRRWYERLEARAKAARVGLWGAC